MPGNMPLSHVFLHKLLPGNKEIPPLVKTPDENKRRHSPFRNMVEKAPKKP